MKTKRIFLLIIFSGFFACFAPIILAANTGDIQQKMMNIFQWSVGIIGLLAAMSFAVGAVQYIASSHANGKERMFGSALGMVLFFSSWIIMQTINPQLTKLELKNMPAGAGIFWVKGSGTGLTKSPAESQIKDTSVAVADGYTTIEYNCFAGWTSAPLIIWRYSKINFQNPIATQIIGCGGKITVSSGTSMKMAFETAGVYFSTGDDCSNGVLSEVYTSSVGPIPSPFAGNIKSAMIIVDAGSYAVSHGVGIIFHESDQLDYGGACQKPYIYNTAAANNETSFLVNDCVHVDKDIASINSADIFFIPKDINSAGTGVSFFSEPTGWNRTEFAGYKDVSAQTIGTRDYNVDADKLKFLWKGSDEPPNYEQNFPTFQDRQGSIQIKGNYLVALYSTLGGGPCYGEKNDQCQEGQTCQGGTCVDNDPTANQGKSKYRCQTFTENTNNLGQESYNNPDYTFDAVKIIPIMAQSR